MSMQFIIRSSDAAMLEKARRIAQEFSQPYRREEIVGIVFLGAIARGYFDESADIDIALFKKQGADIPMASQFIKVEGLEVHVHLEVYEAELEATWEMGRRWTYSQREIHYDPSGLIAELLAEKVPLKSDEKKWLMMSGLVLSEWYISRLTHLWVERGNMVSAHHMFNQGLNYFFDLLFGINDELVADMKWRSYSVEKLALLPHNFHERIQEVLKLNAFTIEEIERRQRAFMEMWKQMMPLVEEELKMSYDEMVALV